MFQIQLLNETIPYLRHSIHPPPPPPPPPPENGHPRPYPSSSSSSSSSSSPEDEGSDTPTELSERSSSFSPEGMEQLLDDAARRDDAREQRGCGSCDCHVTTFIPPFFFGRFVLSELLSSEREYVDRLQYCMEVGSPGGVKGHTPGAPPPFYAIYSANDVQYIITPLLRTMSLLWMVRRVPSPSSRAL